MAETYGAFAAFEQEGWQRAAEQYAGAFGPLTVQAADPLLDAVGAAGGVRLLDVATGPGFIAARAAARGASVVGLDFSTTMIANARRLHARAAGLIFQEGDASKLPFGDAAFDAIVMNFGMLHLARPDDAIREAHRVLRPGGRYAFTVWADPSVAVGFGMVLNAIQQHGRADVPLPEGPPFFRFASADESRLALEGAGFGDVVVRQIPLVWRLASADGVFDGLLNGGVRTAAVLRAQTPAALETIRASVRHEVERYETAGEFVVPMPAILTSAVKSGS